jgi:hypothetical protein
VILRRVTARHGPDIEIVHGSDTSVEEPFATAARGLRIKIEAPRATSIAWTMMPKRSGTAS